MFMSQKRLKKNIKLDKSMEEILAESRNGVFFSAHLGNWEYLLIGLEIYDIKSSVVLKKVKRINDNFLIKYLRKRKKKIILLREIIQNLFGGYSGKSKNALLF